MTTKTKTAPRFDHPAWGCTDCTPPTGEDFRIHSRYWEVSGVQAIELRLTQGCDGPDSYTLSMVELWEDFSADEALLLSVALLGVCQLLDENGLRKVVNKQVNKRLAKARAAYERAHVEMAAS